jgi:diguanylate cyclase (GGDEF)-like protein
MRRLPRPGLLVRFSVLSLVCLVALGGVLTLRLRQDAEANGRAAGLQSAKLLVATTFGGLVRRSDLQGVLPAARKRALDAASVRAKGAGDLVRIKIWTPSGRIAYSDESAIIGEAFPVEDDLRNALAGQPSADISTLHEAEQRSERRYGKLLEVYVPLRLAGERRPAAVFEVYLPYAPIAAAASGQIRGTYELLAAGLVVLWLALFRIANRASSRLRAHAIESDHQARHDPLTGLANRRLLGEELRRLLAARRSVALLLVDLDGFKEINDTLGHAAGDELLGELGGRLARGYGDAGLVARLGGDEFAVIVDGRDDAALLALAADFCDTIAAPFLVCGVPLRVSASVGIARADDATCEPGLLLQRADVAMYRAKRERTRRELYAPETDPHNPDQLALISELLTAIEHDELVLHYQPIVDARSRTPIGAEALVRWSHPRRGLLMPADFVPAAERAGVIGKLTRDVLRRAIADAAAWRARGLALTVAVNISAHDLLEDDFVDSIDGLLRDHALPASALVLELTETAVVVDPDRVGRVLRALDGSGIRSVLDDFGTGYSSLAHLQQLPVRALKIDRGFVSRMREDDSANVIVRATIDLGRALGLRVVAEGVEDAATLDALRALGCHELQGYHLAQPLPADALENWTRVIARRAA